MIISLVFVIIISILIAYFSIESKIRYSKKVYFNIFMLTIGFIAMCITGANEQSLCIYLILIIYTAFGLLTHILSPLILNFLGRSICRLTKEEYKSMSYNEWLRDGHDMYFCIMIFTTLKVLLYIAFYATLITSF